MITIATCIRRVTLFKYQGQWRAEIENSNLRQYTNFICKRRATVEIHNGILKMFPAILTSPITNPTEILESNGFSVNDFTITKFQSTLRPQISRFAIIYTLYS